MEQMQLFFLGNNNIQKMCEELTAIEQEYSEITYKNTQYYMMNKELNKHKRYKEYIRNIMQVCSNNLDSMTTEAYIKHDADTLEQEDLYFIRSSEESFRLYGYSLGLPTYAPIFHINGIKKFEVIGYEMTGRIK